MIEEALLGGRCTQNYVSMFSGWNFLHDYDSTRANGAPPVVQGSFKNGWAIGGAIGRRINNAWRAELEFTFRDNTGDGFTVNGTPGPLTGHANVYSGMTNLYYDFNSRGELRPYVGGGIGFASVDANLNTNMTSLSVDDTAFAYQLIAGVSTAISRNADVFVEYRHFSFDDVEVVNQGAGFAFAKTDFEAENVFIGLRLFR